MTPAATKSAKPDIVVMANAEGQVKNVVPIAKGAAKKSSCTQTEGKLKR
jgi:RNA polymerase primary sigma factor